MTDLHLLMCGIHCIYQLVKLSTIRIFSPLMHTFPNSCDAFPMETIHMDLLSWNNQFLQMYVGTGNVSGNPYCNSESVTNRQFGVVVVQLHLLFLLLHLLVVAWHRSVYPTWLSSLPRLHHPWCMRVLLYRVLMKGES